MPPNGLQFSGRRTLHPAAKQLGFRKPTKRQQRQHISRSDCNCGLDGCWDELEERGGQAPCCTSSLNPDGGARLSTRTFCGGTFASQGIRQKASASLGIVDLQVVTAGVNGDRRIRHKGGRPLSNLGSPEQVLVTPKKSYRLLDPSKLVVAQGHAGSWRLPAEQRL